NSVSKRLAAGGFLTINWTPPPTAPLPYTTLFRSTDNAAGSPQSVGLTGTGVAPAIGLSPSSLSFSNQLVGTSSAVQAVTLSNTGTAAHKPELQTLTSPISRPLPPTNTSRPPLPAT